jgi:hypothetical protein
MAMVSLTATGHSSGILFDHESLKWAVIQVDLGPVVTLAQRGPFHVFDIWLSMKVCS